MIHDHDRCEWVNVSSGTGSPGLSRTKSTEPSNGCSSSFNFGDEVHSSTLSNSAEEDWLHKN